MCGKYPFSYVILHSNMYLIKSMEQKNMATNKINLCIFTRTCLTLAPPLPRPQTHLAQRKDCMCCPAHTWPLLRTTYRTPAKYTQEYPPTHGQQPKRIDQNFALYSTVGVILQGISAQRITFFKLDYKSRPIIGGVPPFLPKGTLY